MSLAKRASESQDDASGKSSPRPRHLDDGVFIYNLKKDDRVSMETCIMGGSRLIIDMVVVNPHRESCAVSVKRVRRIGVNFTKSLNPDDIGVSTPVVVLRGFKLPKKESIKGWLGIDCVVALGSATIVQPVRVILINGLKVFPQDQNRSENKNLVC